MRCFFVGLLLFNISFSVLSFAAVPKYDLKVEVSLNDKLVSSPHLVVQEGEPVTIVQKLAQDEMFLEVVAVRTRSDSQTPAVRMNFVVGTMNRKGEREVLSTPQIVALENETSEIRVGERGKPDSSVSLKVIANQIH